MTDAPPYEDDDQPESDENREPQVPLGVRRGIRDLGNGDTASKEDLSRVLVQDQNRQELEDRFRELREADSEDLTPLEEL